MKPKLEVGEAGEGLGLEVEAAANAPANGSTAEEAEAAAGFCEDAAAVTVKL